VFFCFVFVFYSTGLRLAFLTAISYSVWTGP